MLGLEERLPSVSVQGIESVIVYAVAFSAVLAYDLPHRTVRPHHLRPGWSSSDLRGQWRAQRGYQGKNPQNPQIVHLTPLEEVRCSNRTCPAQFRIDGGCSITYWTPS